MKNKSQTQMLKILRTLDREGPLNNRQISDRAQVPYGTVRSYMSLLGRTGEVERYREMRGVYVITEKGRQLLREQAQK